MAHLRRAGELTVQPPERARSRQAWTRTLLAYSAAPDIPGPRSGTSRYLNGPSARVTTGGEQSGQEGPAPGRAGGRSATTKPRPNCPHLGKQPFYSEHRCTKGKKTLVQEKQISTKEKKEAFRQDSGDSVERNMKTEEDDVPIQIRDNSGDSVERNMKTEEDDVPIQIRDSPDDLMEGKVKGEEEEVPLQSKADPGDSIQAIVKAEKEVIAMQIRSDPEDSKDGNVKDEDEEFVKKEDEVPFSLGTRGYIQVTVKSEEEDVPLQTRADPRDSLEEKEMSVERQVEDVFLKISEDNVIKNI